MSFRVTKMFDAVSAAWACGFWDWMIAKMEACAISRFLAMSSEKTLPVRPPGTAPEATAATRMCFFATPRPLIFAESFLRRRTWRTVTFLPPPWHQS